VVGAVALIADVEIQAVEVGNRPASRYEPLVNGERGERPLMCRSAAGDDRM
jgi:hypothetical protein